MRVRGTVGVAYIAWATPAGIFFRGLHTEQSTSEPGRERFLAQRMLDPGSYRCSSPLRTELSPPFSGPQKRPTAAGTSGLGVRERNDTVNPSPNADLSSKLGAWPIYSTSFSAVTVPASGSPTIRIPLQAGR